MCLLRSAQSAYIAYVFTAQCTECLYKACVLSVRAKTIKCSIKELIFRNGTQSVIPPRNTTVCVKVHHRCVSVMDGHSYGWACCNDYIMLCFV
jgi:hypothetical protein